MATLMEPNDEDIKKLGKLTTMAVAVSEQLLEVEHFNKVVENTFGEDIDCDYDEEIEYENVEEIYEE